MPDLKTELFTKVIPNMHTLSNLSFDDAVASQEQTIVIEQEDSSKPVVERVWGVIYQNPGRSCGELYELAKGFIKRADITTRLSQLTSQGRIIRSGPYGEFRYTAVGDSYRRMTNIEAIQRAQQAKIAKLKNKAVKAQIARAHEKLKPPITHAAPKKIDLDQLTLGEAKELYAQLKQLFGG